MCKEHIKLSRKSCGAKELSLKETIEKLKEGLFSLESETEEKIQDLE
jgi:hypothetical protein